MPAVLDAPPSRTTLQPPLVAVTVPATGALGHDEEQELLQRSDLPAAGWVKHIYRDGAKLKADFAEVPDVFCDLLKRKAYRKMSAEIYTDFEDQGVPYGLVLRRVAFLGAEIPQVKSLADTPPAADGEIKGAEIFATGNHRGRLWTAEDLDQIVQNFERLSAAHVRYGEARFSSIYVFNEVDRPATVTPPRKRQKAKEFSAKVKAGLKLFADQGMPDAAAPPPAGVTPDDMKAMLSELGFDPNIIDSMTPEQMAEAIRVCRSQATPQQGAAMADASAAPAPTATPPLASASAPAPAPTPPPHNPIPSTNPSQVTIKYGEREVQLNEFVEMMVKPIQDRLVSAETSVTKFMESQKKASIDAKLDVHLKEGKVLPAMIDGGLRERLYRANAIAKFADGDTELDKQLKELDALPVLVSFAERLKAGKKGTAGNDSGKDPETEQVEAHYEQFSENFQKFGLTKENRLKAFAIAKKRQPKLTAEEYLRTA